MPRVVQYHNSVIDSDAIGYSITSLHSYLLAGGWDSDVYCSDANAGGAVKPISSFFNQNINDFAKDDITLIVHFSFYDDVVLRFASLPVRKILVYHNITPGLFFAREGIEWLANACDGARVQLSTLVTMFDICIGVSDFNSDELRGLGFKNVKTVPVFVNTEFFASAELDEVFFSDITQGAGTNMVFVGRFVPNKGIANTISTLSHYVRMFGSDIKLHLVGKIWDQNYYARLIAHAAQCGVAHLVNTYIGLDALKLKTLLIAADAFVSMSEHEGFMVPIVEAFAARCPVIANDAGAVRDTMGIGGILLDRPDPAVAAGLVRLIKTDEILRERIIVAQAQRAFDFRPENTLRLWFDVLRDV